MAYSFAALSRSTTDNRGIAIAGLTAVASALRKVPFDGLIGGVIAGGAQGVSMLLMGESLSMSHAVKSVMGLPGGATGADGFAHLALIAGAVLASGALYASNFFHLSTAEVPKAFVSAFLAGVACQLSPCPWGYGGGWRALLPLAVTSGAAFVTPLFLKAAAHAAPILAARITSSWTAAQSFLDFPSLSKPSPIPLVVIALAAIFVRLFAFKARAAGAVPRRPRHAEAEALAGASGLFVGGLYAIALLVGRLHLIGSSQDNARIAAFIGAAAMTTRLFHYILRRVPDLRPLTPIAINAPELAQTLLSGDKRKHDAKLYGGALLSGIAWGLGPVLMGPALVGASAGLGGYGNVIGIVSGLIVGSTLIVATPTLRQD